jgi:hypothetical protein
VAAWQRRFSLPAVDAFPRTTRRDLSAAWRAGAQILGQFDSHDRLLELVRERAIAAAPSSLDDALAQLETVNGWFTDDPDAVVERPLGSVPDGAQVETIYLDVPDTFDRDELREWRATARLDDHPSAVFNNGIVLLPATDQ